MLEPGYALGFIVGIGANIAFLISRSFFRIEQGHLGVVSSFGKAELKDSSKNLLRTWDPGLHFKWPWQKIHHVSMMEQCLDLSGKEGGVSAMASDGTILRLDSKLRYAPIEEELYDFLFALREPIPHIKGLFTCLLRNEIANFKSSVPPHAEGLNYELDSELSQPSSYSVIRRERKLLNQHLERFTREKIGGRYGVRFDAVDLTDILPPDELANSLNAVFSAQTEAHTHYARAQGECQTQVLAAIQGVTIAAEQSKATETEIRTLAHFLKDLKANGTLQSYILRRRAETTYGSKTVYMRRSV